MVWLELMLHRYVENVLQENQIFDAKGLLEKDASYHSRLRFWTNELCEQKPQTFDIVIAVRCINPIMA